MFPSFKYIQVGAQIFFLKKFFFAGWNLEMCYDVKIAKGLKYLKRDWAGERVRERAGWA